MHLSDREKEESLEATAIAKLQYGKEEVVVWVSVRAAAAYDGSSAEIHVDFGKSSIAKYGLSRLQFWSSFRYYATSLPQISTPLLGSSSALDSVGELGRQLNPHHFVQQYPICGKLQQNYSHIFQTNMNQGPKTRASNLLNLDFLENCTNWQMPPPSLEY